jgi:Zn-dependent protease with chaperone function
VHERLGWFVAALAAVSATLVGAKIAIARSRLRRLLHVSQPLPTSLQDAFAKASASLGIPIPTVAYLNLGTPIASTIFGPMVLLSRGFIELLSQEELELVARHELIHAGRRDDRAGIWWHLAFMALLIPGFAGLENRLQGHREHRTNVLAAAGRESVYLSLMSRLTGTGHLCIDATLGLEAEKPTGRSLTDWLAPAVVILLAVALIVSHSSFEHNLPYLETHHC